MNASRPWNRHFWSTLLLLLVLAELALRLVPYGDPRAFRAFYGNTLSMYMAVERRLQERAPSVRVLALGDSLTMTQFQPQAFAAAAAGRDGNGPSEAAAPPDVFNAGYLGMSFPSGEALLRTVGRERLHALEVALVFVNPRRLSPEEEPNTEIFRIAHPQAGHPLTEAWRERRVAPLFDLSRLYGLSRHLTMSAWREALSGRRSWDQLEFLQPAGGVRWEPGRDSSDPPRYPYTRMEEVSPARLAELESVVARLRGWGVRVTLLVPPVHPAVDPFGSPAARARFDGALSALAARHDAIYLPDVGSRFQPADDRDFCDYGHMNWGGGLAYSRTLAVHRDAILQERRR